MLQMHYVMYYVMYYAGFTEAFFIAKCHDVTIHAEMGFGLFPYEKCCLPCSDSHETH